ncbi:hypothetical protein TVAG_281910 [Trichomonas vaginalis G3]|uniref:Uncharacterized protein n=1 Tax=Trichomonas vaginalis (strain ATCC PRA-98 / G3) TaxID=412133 RepID=A2E9Q6_TRIV3|nr:NTF2-like family [Trichomonas vaginalis G3]EAY10591.1 hypothetical protein TVAG_281910 [Trichomonas vaginalis G3]KAI5540843.1 NTF2-like family [Trichomonas vaginalis G3]|eukprot:XP_001322814.1 hypothetical protein [Trichomonas vaginalis G3]
MQRKAFYIAVSPVTSSEELENVKNTIEQQGGVVVNTSINEDIGLFELQEQSMLKTANMLNRGQNVAAQIDYANFYQYRDTYFQNLQGTFDFSNVDQNIINVGFRFSTILFWLKYYIQKGQIQNVNSDALSSKPVAYDKLRFYDTTQRYSKPERRNLNVENQFQGGFPDENNLPGPAPSAQPYNGNMPPNMAFQDIPFMGGNTNFANAAPMQPTNQPNVAPQGMPSNVPPVEPADTLPAAQPVQPQFEQPNKQESSAPSRQQSSNQVTAPNTTQEQAEQPESPPEPEPVTLVQLKEYHFPDGESITNKWLEDLCYRKSISQSAGDYTDEAQFSITIDPTKDPDLLSIAQYTRNLIYGDQNLIIGQESATALNEVVSLMSLYQAHQVEIIENLFYSVTLYGVATLKNNQKLNFVRSLSIVQEEEPGFFRILSDQIHFMQHSVEIV